MYRYLVLVTLHSQSPALKLGVHHAISENSVDPRSHALRQKLSKPLAGHAYY